jgi:hypothetical protein
VRVFSAVAAFAIVVPWLPTLLEFFGVISVSPVPTLYMELTVFSLTFVWLGLVAAGWGRGVSIAAAPEHIGCSRTPAITEKDLPAWMSLSPEMERVPRTDEDSR